MTTEAQMRVLQVALTKGRFAFVDEADYDIITQYQWHAKPGANTWYARNGKSLMMHHLVLPRQSGLFIDHIDGNGLNNTRANLRYATKAQNQRNRGVLKIVTRTSPYKGVHWFARKKKWRAVIYCDNKHVSLGYYHNEIDAARAYDAAAVMHHNEFAQLNFPEAL